jgi:hypothetical protein
MAVLLQSSRNPRVNQALAVSASSLLGVAVLLTISKLWAGFFSFIPIILGISVMAGLIGAAIPRLAWGWRLTVGACLGFILAVAIGTYAVGQI